MISKHKVSIILPCYNPPVNWMENIALNFSKIQETVPDVELIIVNDGSTKNFNPAEAAIFFSNTKGIKLVNYPQNHGKGYALREGVKAANSDWIIYTDIDFPYTHESFLKVFEILKNANSDMAIGIRGEEYYKHLPKARIYISKLLRACIRIFLQIPTDDTQCGLKGFNQKGKEVFLQTNIDRYLFDLEFIFLAARKKLSLQTTEVKLKSDIQLSKMNWKILLHEFGNFFRIFIRSIAN
jgi:glycosyltransferase involved in cell wall biosynthesis